eukprot:CAMPEP_0180817922 /NCGR_PEP_ID=MMETSP1038_2-20121128/68936_1 /TAXON_ID=632150 /ORGANISM="Azadinium spinosum, Strain 3D9" /LENGTH=49 /DNA_ID=CAMNT_0022859831 /DNA_START=590 /DNA_END=739 /DNA_ORIENTATION=+
MRRWRHESGGDLELRWELALMILELRGLTSWEASLYESSLPSDISLRVC